MDPSDFPPFAGSVGGMGQLGRGGVGVAGAGYTSEILMGGLNADGLGGRPSAPSFDLSSDFPSLGPSTRGPGMPLPQGGEGAIGGLGQ